MFARSTKIITKIRQSVMVSAEILEVILCHSIKSQFFFFTVLAIRDDNGSFS
jgi:hypothetical protein